MPADGHCCRQLPRRKDIAGNIPATPPAARSLPGVQEQSLESTARLKTRHLAKRTARLPDRPGGPPSARGRQSLMSAPGEVQRPAYQWTRLTQALKPRHTWGSMTAGTTR
jgi:hypothetical protein